LRADLQCTGLPARAAPGAQVSSRLWPDGAAGDALLEVYEELSKARSRFPPFNSAHEGFAVIKEEVDELWDEVKKNQRVRDPNALRLEARQIAAMALRFMVDVKGDK
jgi:hypothetical protein